MSSKKKEEIIVSGFIGMALIGGIGVSLGFEPIVGGFLGFAIGAIYRMNKADDKE